MDIVKIEYQRINGKLTSIEIPPQFPYSLWVNFCRFLFESIHYKHYQEMWNGKRKLRTIKILGFRKALVDDVHQIKTVIFCWKFGKNIF